ncbi:MAG: DUF1353 domain-containing protein [Candidatus Gastranaerophilales bacterium]|nr:DUF1353 domain-containing protein [Candidatus Gastranaerophilales bacterium]
MNYNSFDVKPKIAVDLDNKVKPFKLLNNIVYISGDYCGKDIYRIVINKGYSWNGANIPRYFWRIIGSQFNPEFLPASMIHDWLCEHKDFIIQNGVKVSSDIFRDILILYGVSKFKANIMANAVRLFQYTQKGWN